MKTTISLSSTSTNRLPVAIIDQLVGERKFWRDLRQRLTILPVVHKGRYYGHMPEQTPHENAIEFASHPVNDVIPYIGYVVYRDLKDSRYSIEPYSFCVRREDERVVDPTAGHDWLKQRVHYVGFPIPKQDIKNKKYLNYFERMSYVLDHALPQFTQSAMG